MGIHKISSVAAGAHALIGVLSFVVAVGFIGLDVLADQTRFIDLALTNPTPLIIQDMLKFGSLASMVILIVSFFQKLHSFKPAIIRIGTFFGILSALCLLVNAILSLYTVTQAGTAISQPGIGANFTQLNMLIGLFALATLMTNGIWYLLIHWSALQSKQLPKGMSYLGIAIGVISLIPFLGLFVLILNIVWALWLCSFWLRSDATLAAAGA